MLLLLQAKKQTIFASAVLFELFVRYICSSFRQNTACSYYYFSLGKQTDYYLHSFDWQALKKSKLFYHPRNFC
jgi:hypothetical protein